MEGTLPLLEFHRPFKCPMGCAKCCCYQEVDVFSADEIGEAKTHLGSIKETCWFCVPMFKVLRADDSPEYEIHQPTCCGGCCVNCCAQGCCCCSCRIPFYVYPVGGEQEVGEITKVWAGLGTELFTDADKFECKFPSDADSAGKARLIGATLMINQLFFEREKEDPAPAP